MLFIRKFSTLPARSFRRRLKGRLRPTMLDPSLCQMSFGDLRALEKDAHGECRSRSAGTSRSDHPDLATNNVAKFTKDQVAFVYGSIWKQRYFTKQGDDYFPLGAQWDITHRKWLPYPRKTEPIGGRRLSAR